MLETIWLWLVRSSSNPEKTSLALKGTLGVLSVIALNTLGIFHYSIPQEDVTSVIDLIVLAVQAVLTAITYVATAVSAIMAAWGGLRKVYTTMQGTNKVLNLLTY